LDKEARRDSDQLTRQWLADRLQRAKRGMDQYSRALVEAANIDQLPQVDRLRSHLDRLIARLRGAPAGYSGFFDLVQVDEELLEDVYEHDLWLMDEVSLRPAPAVVVADRAATAPRRTRRQSTGKVTCLLRNG
jgi:hypothetical protein